MAIDTVDPQAVIFTLGKRIITGYMDGTFINIERDEDAWTRFTGAGGDTARIRNRNKTGILTVTLMQTSQGNDLLSQMMLADENLGIPPGAASIIDRLGKTVAGGADAYILKPAAAGYAKDFQGREWSIVVPQLDVFIGGSLIPTV